MLRRHIIMLIAICPSDGDVKPGGPLSAFREEQATSRHRVSPSLFLSSSSHTPQHNYTTQTTTHTVTLSSIPTVPYTDTRPRCNVVYPSGAWFENRPCSMPSICPVQNLKCIIVQWVGIGTHTHIILKREIVNNRAQRNATIRQEFQTATGVSVSIGKLHMEAHHHGHSGRAVPHKPHIMK